MHTLKTHHVFRNLKGRRPGSWTGAEASSSRWREQTRLSRESGDQAFGSWPQVILLEAAQGSGNGGVDTEGTAGHCNALLAQEAPGKD